MRVKESCEWCGKSLPPRTDPRGRRARYCSAACRSAAYRNRQERKHQAELETARLQTSIDLRSPDEIVSEVVQEIRAAARSVRDRGEVPGTVHPILEAAQELVRAAEPERRVGRQRRRVERRSVR